MQIWWHRRDGLEVRFNASLLGGIGLVVHRRNAPHNSWGFHVDAPHPLRRLSLRYWSQRRGQYDFDDVLEGYGLGSLG